MLDQVKPTCVTLMGIASQPPSPTSSHAGLLDTLTRIITPLPQTSFTPSMINYILFPVTQILRQSDPSALSENFLEAVFRFLSHVVSMWRVSEGGMEVQAWEQLWRFTAAAVGPRLGLKEKSKGRQVGQEVQLEAVRLLTALLGPTELEGAQHPTRSMAALCATAKSPLMPTLFQAITLLLETSAPSPPYLQLQLSSLCLLRTLITTYLKGKPRVLASVLPGMVSTIATLVHSEAKALKGEVAQEAAGLIEDIIISTLKDEDLRSLGVLRPALDDLGQLAEEWEKAEQPLPVDDPPPPSPAPPAATSVSADPFPQLTASYLAFTSIRLLASIPPILSALSTHPSPFVRQASITLSASLISSCHESLSSLLPHCLNNLLQLSQDSFDVVFLEARRRLRVLLFEIPTFDLNPILIDLLRKAMNALPRQILSQQDQKVAELARLITAIAEITSSSRRNPIPELLGPNGHVERWGWRFLDCLEFGRPAGWSAAVNTAAKAAEIGWESRLGAGTLPLLIENGDTPHDPVFPHQPLRHIESEATARALGDMLVALGSAGGEAVLHSVDYFMLFAKANRRRHIAKAVSAVWVGQKLLEGIASASVRHTEAKTSKACRKMARDVTKIIVAMDDDVDDGDEDEEPPQPEEASDALLPVERTSGINALTTILDRKPLPDSAAAAQTRRIHTQAQRSLLTALSLSTLALTSRILSTSFRPLLLTSLYTILSQLASPQPFVAQYAEIALVQVAYQTGYASPQNLVLDNVDYVINVVSQRLTYARLSLTAPLVLIAMIRLVGEPIVPLVHEVVGEIFDALDDYHGYETLASSLLAVLVTLIEAMAAEVDATGPSEERLRKKAEYDRIDRAPDPEEDFARFLGWHRERESSREKGVNGILKRAPQHAWGKDAPPENGETEEQAEAPMDEDEKPPTRTQEVCTQILEKSTYFLSHRSPFLRARILSLIARATPVLAAGNREGDLLPVIDRGWGLILNRLDDIEPYVVSEAAEVIASLCENVGDFMSRRVLDHAWPRFERLLDAQRELDKKSALARRGGVGTQSLYTVSHRLHVAILKTACFIAKEVPVNDEVLWQVMVLFRPFIDRRAREELQVLAIRLYQALARRDADALWVVSHATLGTLEGDNGVWDHLRDQTLDIEENAGVILAGL